MTAPAFAPSMKFATDTEFRRVLNARVDAELARIGKPRRDAPAFYIKAAALTAWTGATYAALVFAPVNAWQAIALAVSLGISTIFMAFNIYHDASHGAASRHGFVNRIGMFMMDAAGVSSYVWRRKHNGMHHLYPNVIGRDCDLAVEPYARFARQQPRAAHHRIQHLYLWPLYGLYGLRWQLDDVRPLIEGRVGAARFQRPGRGEFIQLVLGKAIYFGLAFAIPLTRHDLLSVVAVYLLVSYVYSLVFVCVVMLDHINDLTRTPDAPPPGARHETDWASHQTEVTCDYAHDNRLLSWCLGGLNFHIEHHLFPDLCHVRYRDIASVVRETCKEFGRPYNYKPSLFAAFGGHYRQLAALAKA